MRYGSKTSSSCRKILMLLYFEGCELCIFIVGATPRISETAKSEGRLYCAKLYKTLHTYHRALSDTRGTVDYSAVFAKDNAEIFISFPFDTWM